MGSFLLNLQLISANDYTIKYSFDLSDVFSITIDGNSLRRKLLATIAKNENWRRDRDSNPGGTFAPN